MINNDSNSYNIHSFDNTNNESITSEDFRQTLHQTFFNNTVCFNQADLTVNRVTTMDINNPFKYPGDFYEAKIHENANILGQISPDLNQQVQCKCCGKKVKFEKLQFFASKTQYVTNECGMSIPYLFGINKIFIFGIGIIMSVYLVFFQIQAQKVCKDDKECILFLGLYIANEVQLREKSEIYVQKVFCDIKFTLFILLLVLNIVFYYYSGNILKIKNAKSKNSLEQLQQKSLLFSYIPQLYTQQEIIKNIKLIAKNTYNLNVEIASITHIYDTFNIYNLNQSRMNLLQKYFDTKNDKLKLKYKQKLKQNYEETQKISQEELQFAGMFIVTFKSRKDRIIIHNLFQKNFFLELIHVIKSTYFENYSKKQMTTRRIICSKAPYIKEIIWQNIGYQNKQAIVYSVLLLIFTIIVFLAFPRITQAMYEKQQTIQKDQNIRIIDKIIDYSLSLCFFIISTTVWYGVKYFLDKSYQKSTIYYSTYMIISNLAFHLQFYIIVPIFLFFFQEESKEYQQINYKLYQILTIVIVFNVMSVIEIIFSPRYIYNRIRKYCAIYKKTKYFQQQLNQIFQKPNFPLEKRILLLYKLYSFGIVLSFVCPLSWLYIFVGLIFHLIGNKFTLIHQYGVYNYFNTSTIRSTTKLTSITLIYVVTITYLITENQDNKFYVKESYIKIAKMLLILTVLGSGIGEKLYKTVTKKHKYEKIIKEKLQKRVSVQKQQEDSQLLYQYYNTYQIFQSSFISTWSDKMVQEITKLK